MSGIKREMFFPASTERCNEERCEERCACFQGAQKESGAKENDLVTAVHITCYFIKPDLFVSRLSWNRPISDQPREFDKMVASVMKSHFCESWRSGA